METANYLGQKLHVFIIRLVCLMLLFFVFTDSIHAQLKSNTISEGPYIYFHENQFKAKWIKNGELRVAENLSADFLKSEFGLGLSQEVFQNSMASLPDFDQEYKNVPKFAVISDIHGQYSLMAALLKNHGIIDENLNWVFGQGHLVINGDILGRGNMVTEVLWLAYKLEQQAIQEGGKVHFLLGNHELMVKTNDFRYLNEKYISASKILQIKASELYSDNSVLGNWLKKRPAIIKIDDFLIVHAGISPQFLRRKLTAVEVNKVFFEDILSPERSKNRSNRNLINFLTGEEGPIWYRGYFIEFAVSNKNLDDILAFFGSKHIIVGHTSLDAITALFDGRVIGVDSSIKDGKGGEILIVENGVKYRGKVNGSREKL